MNAQHCTKDFMWLIDGIRSLGYGWVESVMVVDGEPLRDAKTRFIKSYRFTQGKPATKAKTDSFELSQEQLELHDFLMQVGSGIVEPIEVRNGQPYICNREVKIA